MMGLELRRKPRNAITAGRNECTNVGESAAAALEQLASSFRLRVGRILDLVPGRVARVRIVFSLGHDSLEIQPAGGLKELASLAFVTGHPVERAGRGGDQSLEPPLPPGERQ